MTSVTSMRTRAINYFEAEGWPLEVDDEQDDILHVECSDDHGIWPCVVEILEAQNTVLFYAAFPRQTPPERIQAIAEVLHHINFGLVQGNFEFDFSDGEIRFKTVLQVEDENFTDDLFDALVIGNLWTAAYYADAIKKVMDGTCDPVEAVVIAESDMVDVGGGTFVWPEGSRIAPPHPAGTQEPGEGGSATIIQFPGAAKRKTASGETEEEKPDTD